MTDYPCNEKCSGFRNATLDQLEWGNWKCTCYEEAYEWAHDPDRLRDEWLERRGQWNQQSSSTN